MYNAVVYIIQHLKYIFQVSCTIDFALLFQLPILHGLLPSTSNHRAAQTKIYKLVYTRLML